MAAVRFVVQVGLLVVFFVGTVSAAESALAIIPTQTGLVVRFKAPAATIDKIAEFASQLQPGREKPGLIPVQRDSDWGDWIRSGADTLQQSFGENIDLERDWWLFCLNPIDVESGFAIVIPAIDTDSVMEAVSKTDVSTKTESIVYKTYVIHGSIAEIEAARQCIVGEKPGIESRFDEEALAVFNQGDFGAFVDVHQWTSTNAEDLEDLRKGLQSVLSDWIPNGIQPANAPDGLRQAFSQIAGAFVQGITDTEFLALSLALDADDIHFENYLCVKAETPTAAFLRANPGSELEAMSSLPASSAVYFGFQGNQKALTAWTTQLIKSISAQTEPGMTEAHEEIRKGYEQLNYGAFALALPMRPIEQGVLRWLTVCEVDDPARARELARLWNALPDCMWSADDEKKAVPVRSIETYGEYSADVAKFEEGFGLKVGDADLDNRISNIVCGPDGNTTRTVYLKDRILECFGGSKVRTAAAIRRIAEYSRAGFVAESHFTTARKKLGTNANLILMVDVGAITAVSMQLWNTYMDIMVQEMMEEEVAPAALGEADRVMDEGVPDDAPKKSEPDSAGPAEQAEAGDPDPNKPDEVEDAKVAAEAEEAMNAQLAEVALMKFEKETINSIETSRTLMGLSLSFEPRGARVKFAIPRLAIQQAVKAGESILKRSGFIDLDQEVMGIEVEEAE